ncbi:hypothetical protein MKEN_00186100 [Mycena kentingensis (nom. inval.)]|nr:hypothetical protein MKEN_00186100 [Mycena kentingensis (nom. inval.)]
MNDPGLDQPIQSQYDTAARHAKDVLPSKETKGNGGVRDAFRKELQQDEDEEEVGYFQPKLWWFTSTMFPLVAGTFGPLANFFSVCALTQPWRQHSGDGSTIPDPPWLNAVIGLSLAFSLLANTFLLANFGHAVRYSLAQPLTIGLWYLSSLLLIIPLGMTNTKLSLPSEPTYTMTQSYYYAIIAASISAILPTLLTANALGAYTFHAYPASFDPLTVPQRTIMMQTLAWTLYMAGGAGVFARLEGWNYLDGVYWADYTLLTIGLGSDFPPTSHAARALLIPFAVGGLILVGLVIGSIRALVLERGRIKVMRRAVEKERRKWIRKREAPANECWERDEWEVMRRIQRRADWVHRYTALFSSLLAFFTLWCLGALVFYLAESAQGWTYFQALYFSYTSLLTIGYGDFLPVSNAGKPFFVVWSLLAVPTVTILISNVGDVVVAGVRGGLLWTVLPTTGEREHVRRDAGSKGEEKAAEEGRAEEEAQQDGGDVKRMGTDVERLGHAVEHAEEERGHGGGLAARLAREVARLARDAAGKGDVEKNKRGAESEEEDNRRRGEWTWLGEDGPLLSGESETQWMLEKMCKRLEEVLEEEIREKS